MSALQAIKTSAPAAEKAPEPKAVNAPAPKSVPDEHPSQDLGHIIADAKHLLRYAVEAGIEIEPEIARPIVKASQKGSSFWQSDEADQLIPATTKLAAKLHPVSAETLRACREDAGKAILDYKVFVFILALFIIPFSIVGFISGSLAKLINSNVETANTLVLKLHSDLSAMPNDDPNLPTNRLHDLQQLGIAVRVVYSRTNQLNHFLVNSATDHLRASENPLDRVLELPPGLRDNLTEVQSALSDITRKYQKVRLYASNVLDGTSVLWGAVSTCLLPVLYALLGACAAVLRAFTQQTELRTFTSSYATPARFIVAAIGGGVIGLFNINLGEGLTASPLALAFLIGYAADVFFSFLEGSIHSVARPEARESRARQSFAPN